MSERERHGKRRTRPEDAPDPDDRYDPRQGAKKSRKEELSPDLGLLPTQVALLQQCSLATVFHRSCLAGPPRISVRDDLSFSDRCVGSLIAGLCSTWVKC